MERPGAAIGAFHQPSLVVCDTALLQSLSPRDRVSGLGEILKVGLAFDRVFFRRLGRELEALLSLEPAITTAAIARSIGWKARVVVGDERESLGLRVTLNLGHTLGHALEAETGYRRFRHGEAILWGLRPT